MPDVTSVFQNGKKQLHTTRSWDFVGFPQQVQRSASEINVIIGVLGTGIWPEPECFNDAGYSPPPKRWRGTCQLFQNFSCNSKFIGARYYRSDEDFEPEDDRSPRDTVGHGTHTTSTVAGWLVNLTNMMGLGSGTARGGMPSARISVYKIGWADGCSDADILAAFDDAIADGVDIISASLGEPPGWNYFNDSIAIGAFHAMKNGILTSTSVENVAPWILSVAASTIDRNFVTKVMLGNKVIYEVLLRRFMMHGVETRFCSEDSLERDMVEGKIVLCNVEDPGNEPIRAGAAGILLRDDGPFQDGPYVYALPASYFDAQNASKLFLYLN